MRKKNSNFGLIIKGEPLFFLELDVSRHVSISRHVFEYVGLAMPMSWALKVSENDQLVASRLRH